MFLKREYIYVGNDQYLLEYGPERSGVFTLKVGSLEGSTEKSGKAVLSGLWRATKTFTLEDHNNSIIGLLSHLANTIEKIKSNRAYLDSVLSDYPVTGVIVEVLEEEYVGGSQVKDTRMRYTPDEVAIAMVVVKKESFAEGAKMSRFLSDEATQNVIKSLRK